MTRLLLLNITIVAWEDLLILCHEFHPLRTHEAVTFTNECGAREWLGELVHSVVCRVYVVHCDGLCFYLFHEKVNVHKKIMNPLVISGEAGGQFD